MVSETWLSRLLAVAGTLLWSSFAQTTCGDTEFASLSAESAATKTVSWSIASATGKLTIKTITYGDWKEFDSRPTLSANAAVDAKWLAVATQTGTSGDPSQTWPVPAIHLLKCQTLEMTVTNGIDDKDPDAEAITLHFHGLLQNSGRVAMDGPEGITQSGIAPKSSFTYRFLVDQEGTYWVHSHHPGQYEKGIRAPLIVRNTQDHKPNPTGGTGGYNYEAPTTPDQLDEEVVSVSDWFYDFGEAKRKGTTVPRTGEDNPHVCGDPGKPAEPRKPVDAETGAVPDKNPAWNKLVGIEYPPDKVLFNDVGGYELANAPAATKSATPRSRREPRQRNAIRARCNVNRRIRFVNMSAQAKFFVWFSDNRSFQIIELDAISYKAHSTSIFEIASGQRVSILVNGTSPLDGNCRPAYIVAASDPKVGRGTKRCPMTSTNGGLPQNGASGFQTGDKGVQFSHGYLDIPELAFWESRTNELDPDNPDHVFEGERFNIFRYGREVGLPRTYHWLPGNSKPPVYGSRNIRLNLDYRWLISCDPKRNAKCSGEYYGLAQEDDVNDRWRWEDLNSEKQIVGLRNAYDIEMEPQIHSGAWLVPNPEESPSSSPSIHYIRLWEIKYGLAAMMENPSQNDNNWGALNQEDKDWGSWISPEGSDGSNKGRIQVVPPFTPEFPSLFRALSSDLSVTNSLLDTASYGQNSDLGR